MESAQPIKPAFELFYNYNVTAGRYDYIFPTADDWERFSLQSFFNQGIEYLYNLVHPGDYHKVKAHFVQLAQLRPDQVHEGSLEYRLQCDNETYRWFRDRYVIVFGSDEKPNARVGSIRDVTAEKDAACHLQTYAHIVTASSEYLALIDRQYRYQAISSAYAYSLQRRLDEIIGMTVADIMGPDLFQSVLKSKADRCLAGEKVSFQLWHSFPNNERRLLDIVLSPHFEKGSEHKAISAYVERARDITGIAKLEEQLRQSGKLETIGMLTGSIAHDFNNILSAILGYAEISIQMTESDSELQRHLKRILNASNRAADLVKKILNFSRKGERDIRPVQISHIVDELLTLIRASLPLSISIKRDIQSESFVMCDATQVYQIIMNLCSNAGYAMRKNGGVLMVRLTDTMLDPFFCEQRKIKPGRYVQLCVSDTGTGMTAAVQKRIFDPFFTTKEKGKGTGIGLSLTQDIIESYGGTFTVDSALGKGTTFNVYLPTINHQQLVKVDKDEQLPTGNEHILFIDDEDTLADLGKQMIESLGYRVTSRVKSTEALGLFQNQPDSFDLVITDLIMPELTGDELVKRIHKIRPDMPVILLTGFNEEMTPKKVASLGIQKMVIKPVVMKDMAHFIREALANVVEPQSPHIYSYRSVKSKLSC